MPQSSKQNDCLFHWGRCDLYHMISCERVKRQFE